VGAAGTYENCGDRAHTPPACGVSLPRLRPRLSVRERAAQALDDDWPDVLAALRRGLSDKDAGRAARVAIAYVQLVYGRQLEQPVDEQPADPLDVSAMTREQRDALKRRILSQHPALFEELTS
jgi:hypothetical protein